MMKKKFVDSFSNAWIELSHTAFSAYREVPSSLLSQEVLMGFITPDCNERVRFHHTAKRIVGKHRTGYHVPGGSKCDNRSTKMAGIFRKNTGG